MQKATPWLNKSRPNSSSSSLTSDLLGPSGSRRPQPQQQSHPKPKNPKKGEAKEPPKSREVVKLEKLIAAVENGTAEPDAGVCFCLGEFPVSTSFVCSQSRAKQLNIYIITCA